MTDYEFYAMLDGGYANVPFAPKRKSNYIDLPNSRYDRSRGQRVIEDQLELLVACEELGYDGIVVSEQHNGPIGLLGNPMVAGAWLAARTKRIPILVHGAIINAYATPVRMAEELALVDTLSRGRLIIGLPMGHGMQYHSVGVMNPATGRARYREAHELLIKALTEPGPFEWNGEFFQIPYVNLWPKPIQRPHPEIFVAGGGSIETLQFIARHRYSYQAVMNPRKVMLGNMDRLRDLCLKEGYEASPKQIVAFVNIHVAETDKQARRDQNFFRSAMHDNFPPGYISTRSLQGVLAGGYRSRPMSELTFDELLDNGWAIAGSPETVAPRLEEWLEELGAGRVIAYTSAGSKPRWLATKSMTLFAEEVIPRLRKGGRPAWMDKHLPAYETASEFGARKAGDAPVPAVDLGDGGLYDAQTAYLDELREPFEPWPAQREPSTGEDERR
jgi:alkanesulfonate monooxygenase SsuD/methylene tetrahydromethanopterin reductase-like flavin-dependent oxidoreductase (luciferase family)